MVWGNKMRGATGKEKRKRSGGVVQRTNPNRIYPTQSKAGSEWSRRGPRRGRSSWKGRISTVFGKKYFEPVRCPRLLKKYGMIFPKHFERRILPKVGG